MFIIIDLFMFIIYVYYLCLLFMFIIIDLFMFIIYVYYSLIIYVYYY